MSKQKKAPARITDKARQIINDLTVEIPVGKFSIATENSGFTSEINLDGVKSKSGNVMIGTESYHTLMVISVLEKMLQSSGTLFILNQDGETVLNCKIKDEAYTLERVGKSE